MDFEVQYYKEKTKEEIGLEINELANNISGDRSKKQDGKITNNYEFIETRNFSVEEISNILNNLKLLNNLNGHKGAMLRSLIKDPKTKEAGFLNDLYARSKNGITDSVIKDIKNINPPVLFNNAHNAVDVYERLRFLGLNPDIKKENYSGELLQRTAASLGDKSADPRWTDMVDKIFSGKNDSRQAIENLLDKIGFIPTELLTKKKFKGIGGENIVYAIDILRQMEKTRDEKAVKFERAKIINYLFTSGNANALKRKSGKNVSVDANGIFINLKGFHSHLPYGLAGDNLPEYLARDKWIGQEERDEIELRKSHENSEVAKYEEISKNQLSLFAKYFNIEGGDTEKTIEKLSAMLAANLDEFADVIIKNSLILPDRFIRGILGSKKPDLIFALVELGEIIGADISREKLRHSSGLFESHKIMSAAEEAYAARTGILHHPDYYNSVKIIRMLADSEITSKPEEKFLLFVGQFKKSKTGTQHSFVEIMHNGGLARVLVDESKHISEAADKKFTRLEKFGPEDYQDLENSLRVFNYFSTTINRMHKVLDGKYKNWENNYLQFAETGLHFLLTNVTEFYQEASGLYKKIKTGNASSEDYEGLLKILNNAKNKYSDFFYKNIKSASHLKEKFSPEIKISDVAYDKNFLEEARGKTAPDGLTPEFYESNQQTRVCLLNYKTDDPSESIPFHIEESCIDALRIQRERPLINVIGGCRESKASGVKGDPLDYFSSAVMVAADKHKANVGVPGTDSGIGKAFGMKNLEYRSATSHIPHAEKAHLFAINPGGNVFVPGNPYMKKTVRSEVYANAPVDSILTPFSAGWELKGRAKYKSPYLNHVAYMEALYQRIGYGQKKVMVVGNGGLFSVVEINESLQRGADLMLVKNSGRFAEAASCLLENINEIDLDGNQDALNEKILKILNNKLDLEVGKEFFEKDFGLESAPENEDYEVFRAFFIEFLKLAKIHKDKIKITTLADLQSDLDDYLKK